MNETYHNDSVIKELNIRKTIHRLIARLNSEKDKDYAINGILASIGEETGAVRVSIMRERGPIHTCAYEWRTGDEADRATDSLSCASAEALIKIGEKVDSSIIVEGISEEMAELITEPLQTLGMFVGVTLQNMREQTRVQWEYEELQKTIEIENTLVESVGSGIFAYTLPERHILILNSEARRMFDCSEDANDYDFMKMIQEKIVPEDTVSMREVTCKLQEPGDRVEYEFHIKKDSGERLTVRCNTKRMRLPDGRQYILSAMSDVTEQEKLAKGLNKEHRRFRDALKLGSSLFYTLDLSDGYIEQPIVTSSGKDLLEEAGFILPASYDEVTGTLMKKYHLVFLSKDSNMMASRERLLELFRSGVSHFSGECYTSVNSRYYRVLVLLSDLEDNGHVSANVMVYDSTVRKMDEDKTQSLINSLSSIYHAVYYVNVEENRCEVVKLQERAEDRVTFDGTLGDFVRVYLSELVAPVFYEQMKSFLDISTLDERFAGTDVLNMEFQRKTVGWCRGKLVVTGRRADGGVSSMMFAVYVIEDQKQKELQMNYEMRQRWQVVKSFSSVYFSSWTIDLSKDQIEEVSTSDYTRCVAEAGGGNARKAFQYIIDHMIKAGDSVEAAKKFLDVDTLKERIVDRKSISCEFEGVVTGWCRATFISVDEDSDRFVFAVQGINEEKESENETRIALRQAFDAARRANKAKTDFLTSMSHDIRTPMNAIIGMTALAEAHIDDSGRVQDCLGKIKVSGRHLLRLINEVLDMSKIESGQMELRSEVFSIPAMLEELFTIIRPQMEEKKHRFLPAVNEIKHGMVTGDCQRIEQVLMNLIGNSVKYTPDGGEIRLSVAELPIEKEGIGCYEFIIEDNGIGMSDEFVSRLYEPFVRAEDSRVEQVQGTGLGMSISRNIVEMMNGTIKVESKLNEGTRFTVTVCLRLSDAEGVTEHDGMIEASDYSGKLTDLKAVREKEFSDRRALLVEDNRLNAEIAGEVFEMTGMAVENARDGKEAVRMVTESEDGYYDIVFMDIQMPVMNGYEATRALRAIPREYIQKLPIIAMTANAFAEDIQASKEAGMNEHISKPLDLEKLERLMNRWLRA